MSEATIVHFTKEQVFVPDRGETYVRLKHIHHPEFVYAIDDPMSQFRPEDIVREVFEGVRFKEWNGNDILYYFNIEEINKAMPILKGIIEARIQQETKVLRDRVWEKENIILDMVKEDRRWKTSFTYRLWNFFNHKGTT